MRQRSVPPPSPLEGLSDDDLYVLVEPEEVDLVVQSDSTSDAGFDGNFRRRDPWEDCPRKFVSGLFPR